MIALVFAMLLAPPAPSASDVLKSLEASGRQLRTLQADWRLRQALPCFGRLRKSS